MSDKTDFGAWLQGQLDNRNWHQARLARRSGISTGQIARIINNTRAAGPDACRAIAKALELPEELVFREAGLLSPEGKPKENPPGLAEWVHIFKANPDKQAEMLDLARFLSRKK